MDVNVENTCATTRELWQHEFSARLTKGFCVVEKYKKRSRNSTLFHWMKKILAAGIVKRNLRFRTRKRTYVPTGLGQFLFKIDASVFTWFMYTNITLVE